MARRGIDSRGIVIERQRSADMLARKTAPAHELTPAQRRKLRDIAARLACDENKVQAALREVGRLTACDLALELQISDPHARLSELRKAGAPVHSVGWVRQPWGSGRPRTLKLYALGLDGAA